MTVGEAASAIPKPTFKSHGSGGPAPFMGICDGGGAIYEQASVKSAAGRRRDCSNHLFGIGVGAVPYILVRVGPIHACEVVRRRPMAPPRGPTLLSRVVFLTLAADGGRGGVPPHPPHCEARIGAGLNSEKVVS